MAKNKGLIKFSLEMIVVVVIAAIVFTKIVIPIRIDGESMYPTLHQEILLFLRMIDYILMVHIIQKII